MIFGKTSTNFKQRNLSLGDILLILIAGLFINIGLYSQSFIFQTIQVIPLTLCSIYFIRKNHKRLAFFLPIVIPIFVILYPLLQICVAFFLSSFKDFHASGAGLGYASFYLLGLTTGLIRPIFITYICLFIYYFGFHVLSKNPFSPIPERK